MNSLRASEEEVPPAFVGELGMILEATKLTRACLRENTNVARRRKNTAMGRVLGRGEGEKEGENGIKQKRPLT